MEEISLRKRRASKTLGDENVTETLKTPAELQNETRFFDELSKDGRRKQIDFVLAFTRREDKIEEGLESTRQFFLNQLAKKGIQHELTDSDGDNLVFVKLHANLEFLYRYAEKMAVHMNLKNNTELQKTINEIQAVDSDDDDYDDDDEESSDYVEAVIKFFGGALTSVQNAVLAPFTPRTSTYKPDDDDCFTAAYKKERHAFFDIVEGAEFKDADRIRMVEYALRHTRFGPGREDIGINKIVGKDKKRPFSAAYPLHDGLYTQGDVKKDDAPTSLRSYLHENWAKFGNLVKFQPLDQIRNYFGEEVALYFAFTGFYTFSLIGFALLGILVMVYGLSTVGSSTYVKEMCSLDHVMCPECDKTCNYWTFNTTCSSIKFTYIFDNPLTVVYAFLVAIWATTFLEFWKRYNATLSHEWDLARAEAKGQEPIRESYKIKAANFGTTKINPTTQKKEPYVTLARRLPRHMLSILLVMFCVLVLVGAVCSIIVYRLTFEALIEDQQFVQELASKLSVSPSLLCSVAASVVSLGVIITLNTVNTVVAGLVTEFELPRTQQEFDDSYAFKVFCFKFVNYYATMFYIAFFKDTFSGHPANWTYIESGDKKIRWKGCPEGGCNYELAIQLIVTMVGKQVAHQVTGVGVPWLMKKVKTALKLTKLDIEENIQFRWEADYQLDHDHELYEEYIEMAMQFGFITLFSSAFPLAPLCAMINNLFEIRQDAQKYTMYKTRPTPTRVPDIGIWYSIFQFLSILAVITNGLHIAITSSIIPRLWWAFNAEDQSDAMSGFAQSTFSVFNVEDFESGVRMSSNSRKFVNFHRKNKLQRLQ